MDERRFERGEPLRGAAIVFGGALALRAVLALLAHGVGSGLLGDETLYLERAEALLRMAASWWSGQELAQRDVAVFYQRGVWPPLHAIWMAGFVALPIDPVLAARLAVGVVGAASSAVAYAVARALGGERAGVAAGAIHASLPLFLYYGISLWSESLYAALALLLMAALLHWLRSATLVAALLAGLALGAMGMTRAAVVPFLLLMPLFMIATRRTGRAVVHAGLVGVVALGVLAPWNALLSSMEGRPTFFSSRTAVQIWAGNNPYEQRLLDYGATVASFRAGADRALRVAQLEADHLGEPAERTARRLALAHIRSHPFRFVERSIERALVLISHDSFLLRFFATTTTTPIAFAWLMLLWMCSLLGFAGAVALAVAGLCSRCVAVEERALFAVAVLCVLGAPILTVSHTRLAFPALVLLVPVAGLGWAQWRAGECSRPQRHFAVGVGGALVLLSLAILPIHLRVSAQASSWYAPSLAGPLAWMPGTPVYVDFVELRGRGGRSLELRGERPGIEFPQAGGEAPTSILLEGARARDRVRVHSEGQGGLPLSILVRGRDGAVQRASVDPIERDRWNEWLPLGHGLELRWRGGELPEARVSELP